MKTQSKFWWFVGVAIASTAVVLCTIAVLFWRQLSADQLQILVTIIKENFAYFFTAAVILFAAFGFTLDWFFRFYIIPVNQLAEETDLIYTVNPSLRIDIAGSYDVMRLAEIINQSAGKQAKFRQSVEKQLHMARAEIEAEKNILAALLEDLHQGILVCNIDGNIVFYNRKLRSLLARHPLTGEKGRIETRQWIGLGRSVYGFIDRTLVSRALERISHKLEQGHTTVSERFLVGTRSTHILPAEIIPVLDSQHHITGFIVFVEDQVAKLKREKKISTQLQSWQHQLTQCISVIKAAAEILRDESFSAPEERNQLIQIMADESQLAARLLTRTDVSAQWSPKQPWPLTTMEVSEWLTFLCLRVSETAGVDLKIKGEATSGRISIDVHHLTSAMVYVFQQLHTALGISSARGRISQQDSWIYFDIIWLGAAVDNQTLNRWKSAVPIINDVSLQSSLSEILNFHGVKLWLGHHNLPDGNSGLRLLLPAIEGAEIVDSNGYVTILPDSRPEFYDFNLFQQSGQNPELDGRQLSELSYTIFDTETTGLDPQGGDEIISIGAIRIVNSRLLREEQFDQLIDPRRSLPWASVKYHGIRPEMLKDQPYIEQVLPRFHQFTADTILVGHNVAFDMRMLQMKEEQTKIRFDNFVLDTMLLSALVHPAHSNHTMDAIAGRLGVEIVGRHTALGDAIATGEIFLKLLPLLAGRGINTLGQALQASEKTYYARLKY